METPTPARRDAKLKILYWIAAAAMTIAVVLDAMKQPINWLSIGARVTLIVALVLLATAKDVETHGKKLLIYGLIAVSIALLLARIVLGAP
jgi:hypothetical protein